MGREKPGPEHSHTDVDLNTMYIFTYTGSDLDAKSHDDTVSTNPSTNPVMEPRKFFKIPSQQM